MAKYNEPGPQMIATLQAVASPDAAVASRALYDLSVALTLPLRDGVLNGDITSDIFEEEFLNPGVAPEYPLDFLVPGTEAEHTAYTIPSMGRIPERHVQGDFVMVPTYEIGNSIDFAKKYARDARWNVLGRAMEVLEAGHVRKKNTDGWRVLVSAGYGRSLNVYDDRVMPGYMSKRLIELMKNIMRRQAGGNSTSVNRGMLSRLYVSPEVLGDIRNWDLTMVDDVTRREIFVTPDLDAVKVFGVEVRSIDELGVGQEFQTYYTARLGASMPTYTLSGSQTKLEIVVGLDLTKNAAFVRPVRQRLEVQDDPTFARRRRVSMFSTEELGHASLESRACLIGSV